MSAESSTLKAITVSAPSRLHFGLLAIGDQTARKFGGAGLMIDAPRTEVSIRRWDRLKFQTESQDKKAVLNAVRCWFKTLTPMQQREQSLNSLPCEISVSGVPRHRGLGSGTQLALATATALQLFFDQPLPSSEELAIVLERGKRSAIGSYGFLKGGFLVDRGVGEEPVAPLDMRIDFPAQWKIVLIEPELANTNSVSGQNELDAFQRLPATTQEQADAMAELLKLKILPSILNDEFENFADAVTQYGHRSGMYYSSAQGGPYASKEAEALVKKITSAGKFGIGQSSWGPTIFAIAKSEAAAISLVEKLREQSEDTVRDVSVVSADNRGMTVQKS